MVSGAKGEPGFNGGPGVKGYRGDPGYYGNKGAKGFRGRKVFDLTEFMKYSNVAGN